MPTPMVQARLWHLAEVIVRTAVMVGAITYLATYLGIAVLRADYPFALEWMEGGALEHTRRLLEGKPLYVAPSLDFTPYIYPPLYFRVSALVAMLVGDGFLPMRMVSIAASLACMALIGSAVWLETKDRYGAFFAAAFYAATFRIGGAWLDMGRVDSLFLGLTLASIVALRLDRHVGTDLLAGGLGVLAFFTKQTALVILAPLVLYSFGYRRGWRRIAFSATLLLGIVVTTFWLDWRSDGWFRYYIFELPSRHHIEHSAIQGFWRVDLLAPLPIACCAGLAWLLSCVSRVPAAGPTFWLLAGTGMLCGAWSSRLHSGGYANVLMPAYAFIAIALGMALSSMRAGRAASLGTTPVSGSVLAVSAYFAVGVQLILLTYNLQRQLPSVEDLKTGRALVSHVRTLNGGVLLPSSPEILRKAGKPLVAQRMALDDVLRATGTPAAKALDTEIRMRIASGEFDSILMDIPWYEGDIQAHYRRASDFNFDKGYWPVTGWRSRPDRQYTRSKPPAGRQKAAEPRGREVGSRPDT